MQSYIILLRVCNVQLLQQINRTEKQVLLRVSSCSCQRQHTINSTDKASYYCIRDKNVYAHICTVTRGVSHWLISETI